MLAAYDHDDISEDDWDPWGLDEVLYSHIIAYYKKNQEDSGIKIVLEEENRRPLEEEEVGDGGDDEMEIGA